MSACSHQPPAKVDVRQGKSDSWVDFRIGGGGGGGGGG